MSYGHRRYDVDRCLAVHLLLFCNSYLRYFDQWTIYFFSAQWEAIHCKKYIDQYNWLRPVVWKGSKAAAVVINAVKQSHRQTPGSSCAVECIACQIDGLVLNASWRVYEYEVLILLPLNTAWLHSLQCVFDYEDGRRTVESTVAILASSIIEMFYYV